MKKLQIADNLALPIEAITEKLAFLGRTGTGKTYAAMKFAELMLEAGAQVVALDFVGKWYGLRVPGLGEPFPIPVFGGLNGDYPLEATAGRLVADIIVDRGISCVLDVSQFIRSEQVRFCYDFATQFFQRKKALPSACHIFIEECQECLPQNPEANEAPMLGAFQRIWKLGRNFGIGGSLITQRPQEVNKKALNMSGTLVVFQMTGPQERKTIKEWISSQGANEDIVEILPGLSKGRPHVWSVAFDEPISKTVQILPKRSADVSSTPTVNAAARKEKPLTPIDVPALREAMAATIEKSKADDPKELKRQIAELKRQQAGQPNDALMEKWRADERAFQAREVELLGENLKLEQEVGHLRTVLLKIHEGSSVATGPGFANVIRPSPPIPIKPLQRTMFQRPDRTRLTENFAPALKSASRSGEELPKGERKILIAIAQTNGGVSREQVGILCDYKRASRDAYIARLSARGYVTSDNGQLAATDAGIKALGDSYEPPPTGNELLNYWLDRLPEGEAKILKIVAENYPKTIHRETIDGLTDYKRSSRDAYLARLSTRKLVSSSSRGVVASDMLFD